MERAQIVAVRRYWEERWNGADPALADLLVAPDFVLHGAPTPAPVRGPDGVRALVALYRGAFPDARFALEDLIAVEDRAAVRWYATGTHAGPLLALPPTGRRVRLRGQAFHRLRGAQLVESWAAVDMFGLLRQLGARYTLGAP